MMLRQKMIAAVVVNLHLTKVGRARVQVAQAVILNLKNLDNTMKILMVVKMKTKTRTKKKTKTIDNIPFDY